MADQLTDYLMQDQKGHASISPEALEHMGKTAANKFLSERISLNESIAKLAGAYADINSEQIKRVVEFANQAVYLALHEKNKTAGAASSYPRFPLADASVIIQDLSDGARPTVMTPTDIEYGRQPEKKAKMAGAKSDELLADLFQVKEAAERAMPEATIESAYADIDRARQGLIGMKTHLEHSGEQLDMSLKLASASYYDIVKRHLLDGGSFSEVMAAARSTGMETEKIASVLKPMVEQLLTEKVASAQVLQQGVRNLEKIAHRVVNPDHPLVTTFRAVTELQNETAVVETALSDVDQRLSEVQTFIKENFLAG